MGDLIEAVKIDDAARVKELLDSGIDPNGYEDDARGRPLHFAAQYNALQSAQVLLRAGANSKLETDDGITPVQVASACFYKNMAALLLSSTEA